MSGLLIAIAGGIFGIAVLGYYVWDGILAPALYFINAIERPQSFRLSNREDPLLCPSCRKARLCRHGYGSSLLWSCHECNHLQFDPPKGY